MNDAAASPPFSSGDPEAAIRLLRALRETGDEGDQRETASLLFNALNDARPEGAKMFPQPVVILLDSGPLGLVTNPKSSPHADACNRWLESLLARGARVLVPEIVDYEIRRELIRANKHHGIESLDSLNEFLGYLPLTTAAMRLAAHLWASARDVGKPTADDLSTFTRASHWTEIRV